MACLEKEIKPIHDSVNNRTHIIRNEHILVQKQTGNGLLFTAHQDMGAALRSDAGMGKFALERKTTTYWTQNKQFHLPRHLPQTTRKYRQHTK